MLTLLAFSFLAPLGIQNPPQQAPERFRGRSQASSSSGVAGPAGQPIAVPLGGVASATAFCADALVDQANHALCIQASSSPTLGMLFPLSQALFVSPAGRVGMGTTAPEAQLHVNGDLRGAGRMAIGSDAAYGVGADGFARLFETSSTIQDFSASTLWDPFRSIITIDPQIDLTGPAEAGVYSHDLLTIIPETNPHDLYYLQGPYEGAFHYGSGHVETLAGSLSIAYSRGTVSSQVGETVYSYSSGAGSIDDNLGLEVLTGHYGSGGSINNNYGLYVYSPYADGPLQNHYGIYLEDQDFGQADSYAIYAAGGATYLGGDVTIDGDITVTGAKHFVQPHPTDPSKEIRFVCLEGNEEGTYFRGQAELRDGVAVLEVPEEFRLVSEPEGLTVQVTPMGPDAGLWVESSDLHRIVVKGRGNVRFSYFVNGVRAGRAGFQAIQERTR